MTLKTEGCRPEDAPPEAEVERLAREILISRETNPETAYEQAERFLRYHDDWVRERAKWMAANE